jgi:hypothetical protein
MDIDVPITTLDDSAASPFDYLCFTFFEHLRPPSASPDCVVWASRGGGKTFYAAVATLLDLIFKPSIEIKVLGGSLDQSRRMHEHLRRFIERPLFRPLVDGKPTDRRTRLVNQSSVEILAQSHTSIRGTRPQKLRCDEVELFDPDVWRAAQLVTRSKLCGIPPGQSNPIHVRGTIEALSTMHKPRGLMTTLINTAAPIPRITQLLLKPQPATPTTRPTATITANASTTTATTSDNTPAYSSTNSSANSSTIPCLEDLKSQISNSPAFPPPTADPADPSDVNPAPPHRPATPNPDAPRALFRWTTIDVLEHCPPERLCDTCELFDDCQSRAKLPRTSPGHLTIDDAIILKRRADRASWQAEMLCQTPRHSTAVFPEYDERAHLLIIENPRQSKPGTTVTGAPAPSTLSPIPSLPPILGMDFGYRGHTAILWAHLTADQTLIITHERVLTNTSLDDHIQAITSGNPNHRSPKAHAPATTSSASSASAPNSLASDSAACSPASPSASSAAPSLASSAVSNLKSQISDPESSLESQISNPAPPTSPISDPPLTNSPLPRPAWIAADPAGNQRSIQSGVSPVHHMRQHGLIVKTPRLPLHEGLELIRRRLAPAIGSPRLLIHPRCTQLRAALTNYRYPDSAARDNTPLKDGHDHPIDALRYLITALDHHHTITVQRY